MDEEEGFLRAILAAFDDADLRRVYADWLEDRADPRAEYVRLGVELDGALRAGADGLLLRQRMQALQGGCPSAWLAMLGDHCSADQAIQTPREMQAALLLGRPARYTDEAGYERILTAAAVQGLTDAVAYVEERSRWVRQDYRDIEYRLHLRHPDGQTSWEPETYNPFFGCDVQFLEWYGRGVVLIYREKHRTYAARVGLGSDPDFREIADSWALDGPHLGYRGYRETRVSRLAVPSLDELPPLSDDEADAWGLTPVPFL